MKADRREIELPSGRKVTVKELGVAELFRVSGALPNLTADGDTEGMTTTETMNAGIRMILECVVEPKFFFDLRDETVRATTPIEMPAGSVELDLGVKDFWHLVSELSDGIRAAKESVAPLPETATP